MSEHKPLSAIRRNYGDEALNEVDLDVDPIQQFKTWFDVVLSLKIDDPTAFVLSTVDERGIPDSRVLLLKGIEEQGFVFFSNYESAKATQLKGNPHAALNFYWPSMVRQIRVRGTVQRTTRAESAAYFASRPLESRVGALASPQSHEIPSREFLEEKFNRLLEKYHQEPISCPDNWGGYLLRPDEIEFWQGRDSRLHDRIHYYKENGSWKKRRLAP